MASFAAGAALSTAWRVDSKDSLFCFVDFEWRSSAFDRPMTRQLSFAVDGVVENFLERCLRRLLKIAGGCGWQR